MPAEGPTTLTLNSRKHITPLFHKQGSYDRTMSVQALHPQWTQADFTSLLQKT